ncbi:NAD(P)H-dependent oxidoreductase [Pseudodonghicola sp.]|uniref:NAD(P)H-dependent oxidoreductase n=1 Tax=Pseudodonghicola sp. TaxID=1969463 RepID=UPI003A9822AB
MTDIVGLAGSLNLPSRTRALVEAATRRVTELSGLRGLVHDLTDLGPGFGTAQRATDLEPQARAVFDRIVAAKALVIGTPVHKGSYAGLFKHLFDLMEPEALRGKPVLLTATGGGLRHALVIEHQLRPLFGFFEADTMPTGVYAGPTDILDGAIASPEISARLNAAAGQLVGRLARHPQPA